MLILNLMTLHSQRVTEYSCLIAKELGWNTEDIENLKNAAYLHDIGKIGIPDTVLNKPTKLTDEEFSIIKEHTTIGANWFFIIRIFQ